MSIEKFRWVAGVIAAHPNGRIISRARLQGTIKLLQSVGMPTDYDYMTNFYGPYSEGLQADVGLLGELGLVRESVAKSADGKVASILSATEEAQLPEIDRFSVYIDLLSHCELPVLDLAATYDAYLELGLKHQEALSHVRKKTQDAWTPERETRALEVLEKLGIVQTSV